MKYDRTFLEQAHKRSIYNEREIRDSKRCGCFYCLKTFGTDQITDWTDEDDPKGKTALCPFCDIDSVLSDKLPIHDEVFLNEMHEVYFNE